MAKLNDNFLAMTRAIEVLRQAADRLGFPGTSLVIGEAIAFLAIEYDARKRSGDAD